MAAPPLGVPMRRLPYPRSMPGVLVGLHHNHHRPRVLEFEISFSAPSFGRGGGTWP